MRVGLAVALGFAASVAEAQTSPGARTHFEAGLAAVDRRDFPRALAEFEAARAIEETAKVVYNVAGCLKALHRPAAALAAYERVVELGVENLPAANRPNVAPFIEDLRGRVAWLSIRTTPEGAHLLVDGRDVERQPVAIDPGVEVTVEARLEGHATARTAARPGAPGPLSVSLELAPIPATAPAPTPSLTLALPQTSSPARPAPARPTRREPEPRRSVLPWLIAGAAVVVAGAGAGMYFALQTEPLDGDARVSGP